MWQNGALNCAPIIPLPRCVEIYVAITKFPNVCFTQQCILALAQILLRVGQNPNLQNTCWGWMKQVERNVFLREDWECGREGWNIGECLTSVSPGVPLDARGDPGRTLSRVRWWRWALEVLSMLGIHMQCAHTNCMICAALSSEMAQAAALRSDAWRWGLKRFSSAVWHCNNSNTSPSSRLIMIHWKQEGIVIYLPEMNTFMVWTVCRGYGTYNLRFRGQAEQCEPRMTCSLSNWNHRVVSIGTPRHFAFV